jgi:hypothetical protein
MEKMSLANYLDVSDNEISEGSQSRHKKKKYAARSPSDSSSRKVIKKSKSSKNNKKKKSRRRRSYSSSSSSSSNSSRSRSRNRREKSPSSRSSSFGGKIKVPKWSTVDEEDFKNDKKIITIGKKIEPTKPIKFEDLHIKPNENIPVEEKEKPDFEPSGLLAKQTNTKK